MKRYLKSALAVAATALVVVSCGGGKGSKKKEASAAPLEERVPTVTVQIAQKEEVLQSEMYSASVEAYAVNNIAPQSSGRIQRIYVDVGSFVGRGQVLAEMDRSQLEQSRLSLKNDSTELGRLRQLYSEGGVSKSELDAQELSYNVKKSTFDNLMENTVLRAPISGVISERNYDRGDMYTMGKAIFVLQQIAPVKIIIGVSESDYTKVKRGDVVTITVDALPDETFTGRVSKIYPTVDATTHTVDVEVQVPNTDAKLRPGMYARVQVNFGSNNSIVIPDAAVVKMQGSGQRSVYVVSADNVATDKVVTLGRHFDGKYEILSGLEEGDHVVIKGQNSLRSGTKVEVSQEQ